MSAGIFGEMPLTIGVSIIIVMFGVFLVRLTLKVTAWLNGVEVNIRAAVVEQIGALKTDMAGQIEEMRSDWRRSTSEQRAESGEIRSDLRHIERALAEHRADVNGRVSAIEGALRAHSFAAHGVGGIAET